MSITIVTKSSPVLVRPSITPATLTIGHTISLSSFDKALAFFPITSFYVFDHAIHEPAEAIRRALSRALVHYFPIAGRAAVAADGEIRLACTGEGVAFVAASASCSLQDVKLFDPPFATLLKELAVDYEDERFRPSDPLMLVQVTEFSCGGFVLGVTRNHVVADGKGMAQFLRAVSELARGLPRPSVYPVTCSDDSLPDLPRLAAAIEERMVTLEPQDFAYLDITIPLRVINTIKDGLLGRDAGHSPGTVFEAVVAVLWQCRTRVVVSDPAAPAPLVFAANVRKHVGAKDGYYGNCVTSQAIVPTIGDVNDVVKLIKRAKQGIPDQFKKTAAGGEEEARGTHQGVGMEALDVLFGYNAFFVSCWRNLGHDEVDFGGGTPARVMCNVELTGVPNCVACLPCKGKTDGANVLALCVRKEHAEAFLAELQSSFDRLRLQG